MPDATIREEELLESGDMWDSNPLLMKVSDIATNHCTTCIVVFVKRLNCYKCFSKVSRLFLTNFIKNSKFEFGISLFNGKLFLAKIGLF